MKKNSNKSGRSHFVNDYVTSYIYIDGKQKGKRVLLEGKEYDEGYWAFHRDHHNKYGFSNPTYARKNFEEMCRSKNKKEIIKWLKDNEYEVLTQKPGCLYYER